MSIMPAPQLQHHMTQDDVSIILLLAVATSSLLEKGCRAVNIEVPHSPTKEFTGLSFTGEFLFT